MSASMSAPLIVWFDMDGVICDFEAGVRNLTGRDYEDLSRDEVKRFWSRGVVESQLFSDLPKLRPGLDLLQRLASDPRLDLRLLTSTGGGKRHFEIIHDKAAWLVRIGLPATQIAVCCVPGSRAKVRYVTPGALLIDDFVDNTTAWNNAGGHGLLYTPERAEHIAAWIDDHLNGLAP